MHSIFSSTSKEPSGVLHAEGGVQNLPTIINPAKAGLLIWDILSKALFLETLNASAAYLLSGHAVGDDAVTVWLNGQKSTRAVPPIQICNRWYKFTHISMKAAKLTGEDFFTVNKVLNARSLQEFILSVQPGRKGLGQWGEGGMRTSQVLMWMG